MIEIAIKKKTNKQNNNKSFSKYLCNRSSYRLRTRDHWVGRLIVYPISYVLYPISYVLYPTSYILCLYFTSYILYFISYILYPILHILHLISYTLYPLCYKSWTNVQLGINNSVDHCSLTFMLWRTLIYKEKVTGYVPSNNKLFCSPSRCFTCKHLGYNIP